MPCVHLRKLYQLCQQHEIRIGTLDMVRLTCNQCNIKDVCPSVLVDEFEFGEDQNTAAPAASREPDKKTADEFS